MAGLLKPRFDPTGQANPPDRPAGRPAPVVSPKPQHMPIDRTPKPGSFHTNPAAFNPAANNPAPTYTGDGGYGDRLAPYIVDPTAGKARLQGQIDDITGKLGGLGQGADQDRMRTTYQDTLRDYGMLMQDLNAYVAKPEMRAGAAIPRPQWEPYQQVVDQSTPGYMSDIFKRGEDQMNPAIKTPVDAPTNMLPPAPLPPALPPVNGTITDAYRRRPVRRGLLNPPV